MMHLISLYYYCHLWSLLKKHLRREQWHVKCDSYLRREQWHTWSHRVITVNHCHYLTSTWKENNDIITVNHRHHLVFNFVGSVYKFSFQPLPQRLENLSPFISRPRGYSWRESLPIVLFQFQALGCTRQFFLSLSPCLPYPLPYCLPYDPCPPTATVHCVYRLRTTYVYSPSQ